MLLVIYKVLIEWMYIWTDIYYHNNVFTNENDLSVSDEKWSQFSQLYLSNASDSGSTLRLQCWNSTTILSSHWGWAKIPKKISRNLLLSPRIAIQKNHFNPIRGNRSGTERIKASVDRYNLNPIVHE